jgi:hypothetical protein
MAIGYSTNALKSFNTKRSIRMSTSPHKTEGGGVVITVDAIPEDEEVQDELNRTMRKPGAPPYDPNAKWLDPAKPTPNGGEGDQASLPKDSTKESNEG